MPNEHTNVCHTIWINQDNGNIWSGVEILTGRLYCDFKYQSRAFRTILEGRMSDEKVYWGFTLTYKSSLIVEGFPNCVAVERSKLKHIIQTRARFKTSRSSFSFFGFVGDTWWRLRSVAILRPKLIRDQNPRSNEKSYRIARPVYNQLRSSSHLLAGTA
jgi:hypothetical protein